MKRLLVFLVGLGLGVGLAMLVGWVLFPLAEPEVTPASMRTDYREEYVRLVAVAYQADADLMLAERRLRALHDDPTTDAYAAPLVAQIEQWIAEERSADLIEPMVWLARDFGVDTPVMAPYVTQEAP
jgi:hypothetical protein